MKAVRTPTPIQGDPKKMSFIMGNYNNLIMHISIPTPHTNIEDIAIMDYQVKEVELGKAT